MQTLQWGVSHPNRRELLHGEILSPNLVGVNLALLQQALMV
jgi:hypothetical protein